MRALIAVLVFAQTGCLIQTITTEVAFKQPSDVALTRDGETIVAARSGDTTQRLASGRVETFGASAAYEAKAVRAESSSIWIEWNTKLPLMEGERTKVLGSEPLVFNAPLASVMSNERLGASSLVLPLCATIDLRAGYRIGSTWHASTNLLPDKCNGNATIPYALETDWSNVVIHEKTRPNHSLAWMTIALSALAFPPFAIIIDTTSPDKITGGVPSQVGFTIGVGIIVAAFWGAVMPTLFASDRDVIVQR